MVRCSIQQQLRQHKHDHCTGRIPAGPSETIQAVQPNHRLCQVRPDRHPAYVNKNTAAVVCRLTAIATLCCDASLHLFVRHLQHLRKSNTCAVENKFPSIWLTAPATAGGNGPNLATLPQPAARRRSRNLHLLQPPPPQQQRPEVATRPQAH